MSYKQMYISLIPYSDGCSQIMSKLGKQFNIVVVHNNKHVVHGLSLTCTIDGLHPKNPILCKQVFSCCHLVCFFPCYTNISLFVFVAVQYGCHPQCTL